MGCINYYDYNDFDWKKMNGAVSYSMNFNEYILPHLRIPQDTTLSSAPFIKGKEKHIQILHEYNDKTIERCKSEPHYHYITHYAYMRDVLHQLNIKATFIPMGINSTPYKSNMKKDWIYFGNVKGKIHRGKRAWISELKSLLYFDVLSENELNGKPIDQPVHEILSQYKYGIGVGRCALEMFDLGMKVLICGERFGGIVTNDSEWYVQQSTNCNGRLITYSNEPEVCISQIDRSIIPSNIYMKDNLALYKQAIE